MGRLLPSGLLTAVLLVVTGAGTPAHAQTVDRYAGTRMIRVDLKTRADLVALERSGAVILDCIPGVGPMTAVVTPEQQTQIEQRGLNLTVIEKDVSAMIAAEKTARAVADPFTDFFIDYHPYGDASTAGTILWYMNELVTLYPTLASIVDVGTTLEGRTIWGLRVSNDAIADKPAVVYFGAEHCREWITTTIPNYFATYLLQGYGTDPIATDLVDHVEFFLIPVLNVDGYLYTWGPDRFWRKNRRDNGDGSWGVDINRNWGEGWGDDNGSSPYPSDSTYRGTAPFSEPETQALRDFFLAHPNVRAMLDIHSYTQLILWPFGYTPEPAADTVAYASVGYAMQDLIYDVHGILYSAGPIFSGIYPVSGGSIDWTYGQRDIFSFSYECRPLSSGDGGFDLPADQIIPNNEELLPAMLHLSNTSWVRDAIRYRFSEALPVTIAAGSEVVIPLDIIEQGQSVVAGTARLRYRYDPSGPFVDVPLAPLAGEAYEGVLPPTNCLSTPEFSFTVTGDSGTTVTSPPSLPDDNPYVASMSGPAIAFFFEGLDSDPGWTTEGDWAWGQPTGQGGAYGGPDPTSGYTGSFVYGYNLSGDYPNSLSERHLTSPAIDCTGQTGVQLSFERWLGVEQSQYDHAYVRVSSNGVNWVTVWENQGDVADVSWVPQEIDISAVADNQPTVYLRWTMGTTDGAWRYCGWNIDDIQLSATSCTPVWGDHDGNGDIDQADYTELELCYTGPTGPFGPGCAIFDFDADTDVDCDDGDAFAVAWTGSGDAPLLPACDEFGPPTAAQRIKNRYISFTPRGGGSVLQAFRITVLSNPLFPETVDRQEWVGAPDSGGVSRLQCDPVYREWGYDELDLSGRDIVPGATYSVEATLDGVDFLPGVTIETVPRWGDVIGGFEDGAWTGPNDSVEIMDVVAMVDRFRNLPVAPPMSWCDVYPDEPDGTLEILDIVTVLDAFRSLPYPFDVSPGCP